MQILVFILLKLVEVGFVVFVPWLVGTWYRKIYDLGVSNKFIPWFEGFIIIFFICAIGFIILNVLSIFISLNWGWAGLLVS